jgi:hypothetical protein
MCLNETYSRVRVGKHLSDMFPIRIDLKQDALLPLLFNFDVECSNGAKAMVGILAGAETRNKCSMQLHRQPLHLHSHVFIVQKVSLLRSINCI